MEFIEATTLFALKIRRWSGEEKASPTDITLGEGGSMPPPKILELGRKRLIAPDSLNAFTRIRKSAERNLLVDGTRFLGGFAVLDDNTDAMAEMLDALANEYRVETQKFMDEFDSKLAEWRQENADFAHAFQHQLSREQIERKFVFSYQTYKLVLPPGACLDEEELADDILGEVGTTCRELSKRLKDRKNRISGDSLRKLISPMKLKLDKLSFGNGRLLHVLSEFEALEQLIPDAMLDSDTPAYKQVITFLSLLGDRDLAEDIVNGSYSVREVFTTSPVVFTHTQNASAAAFF